MFKKHWPKFIPIFVLLFLFLAGMIYRGIFEVPMNKKVVAQFPHYSVMELDRKYYLRINEINGNYPKETPAFSSSAQMRDRILDGDLTPGELFSLFTDKYNIDYEHDLLICNPMYLYKPTFESGLSITNIEWSGVFYTYTIHDGSTFPSSNFYLNIYEDEYNYQKFIEENYNSPLNLHKKYLSHTETDPNNNATIYNYNWRYPNRIRCYELQTKAGNISIIERYDEENNIPSFFYFFGCCDDVYFSGEITNYFLNNNWTNIETILQSMDIILDSPT